MKRHTALCVMSLLLTLFGTPPVSAQTHYEPRVSVGVKGGVALSRVFFNPSVKQSMLMGAVAGVTFRYVEENHFGLIAELNLAQRGWKENFGEAPYRYSRTVSYLQLPVLAHIYFGRRGRFFFNAGPEVSLRIGSSTSANFNPADIASLSDFPSTHRNTQEMQMAINQKVDFGINAGLGAEFFATSRSSLHLEARFYYGLGNMLKSGRTEPFNSSNSMSVSATLGYWFRLK